MLALSENISVQQGTERYDSNVSTFSSVCYDLKTIWFVEIGVVFAQIKLCNICVYNCSPRFYQINSATLFYSSYTFLRENITKESTYPCKEANN